MPLDLLLISDECFNPRNEDVGFYSSVADYLKETSLAYQIPCRPSLAMALLTATLRNNGFTVEVVDGFMHFPKAYANLRRWLREGRPAAVGLGTTSVYEKTAVRDIVAYIRRECPGAKILLGGAGVQRYRELADLADVAVLCDGEEAIVEILACLKGGGDLSKIEGIAYRASNSERLVFTGPRPWYEIGRSPFPDWSFRPRAHSIYPLETQRGCPYACGFCPTRIYQGPPRCKSVRHVLEEVRRNYEEYGIRYYRMTDQTFTFPVERCRELCEAVARLDIPLRWTCYARVEHMPSLAEWLFAAGCRGVFLGLESGDAGMLTRMKKGHTLEQAGECISACRKAGLKTYGSFVIGYPGETEESVNNTARCIRGVGLDFFRVTALRLYPRIMCEGPDRHPGLQGDEHDWRHDTGDSTQALGWSSRLRLETLQGQGPYFGGDFDLHEFVGAGLGFEDAQRFQESRGYLLSHHLVTNRFPGELAARGFTLQGYERHLRRARSLGAATTLSGYEAAYGTMRDQPFILDGGKSVESSPSHAA